MSFNDNWFILLLLLVSVHHSMTGVCIFRTRSLFSNRCFALSHFYVIAILVRYIVQIDL